MPYFTTSAEWLEQSSLLLKARPTTTKITSKYSFLAPSSTKIAKQRARLAAKAPTISSSSTHDPASLKATLTLKTYDPESGTCLKYQTDKAAEVGRLVGSLGKLGRHMAALPEDLSASVEQGSGTNTPAVESGVSREGKGGLVEVKGVPAVGAGGGAKKKKKKGKK
ncbi:hypothetical protein K432DRAFT_332150 [Lepidopterella palustris CBS 459.81]|uniref:SRP9 domain-containing protein n=1 Tax=Lepidopterella palustris CBS 459.81 TaxID=1314670 RepID=A0A8E2JDA5_9PEZI|nr:hypothetical protein K432DRAFT_332150 [Lepidopterella palustris CBS 459.81]